MLLKERDLMTLGYHFHTSMSIGSTDREPEELLKKFDVDSFDKITTEHPKVKEQIDNLVKHMKNKGETLPDGGSWVVYRGSNDIAWTYIDIAYVSFEPKSEITICRVKDSDGNETKVFLKEVSAEKIKDFKYFDANDKLFDGEVISSDTFIYFHLKRIEKAFDKA